MTRSRLMAIALLTVPTMTAIGTVGCSEGARTADDRNASAVRPSPNASSGAFAPAELTPQERANGWRLLFDGETLDGWRGFGRDRPPAGWSVEAGTLHLTPGIEAGDLLTVERFADFELKLEWKIEEGGNSGVFFHVTEDFDYAYESGPEMQILDNDNHADGADPLTSAGSNFALHAPNNPTLHPVGEWNEVMIRVQGPRVEHWVNGGKVVEYELWTEDWKRMVRESKFVDMPGYGLAREGHIDLQDHGDPVWFRNIRVRVLH